MSTRFEALVVHGAGLTPENELPKKAIQRMDTAISAWGNEIADHMIVSGGYSFMRNTPPPVSEASVMEKYAIENGVPDASILKEARSLDTIGNALFTKTDIIIPKNLGEHIGVVTSWSHMPRALEIFQHVMGKDFEITGIPAPENVTLMDKGYEMIGELMMREVFRGTKPGDDEAIRDRLEKLVPGYTNGTKRNLAVQSFLGIFRSR
jgi:uncharacterized SAM-binding protein YcdF (DUF218 family)